MPESEYTFIFPNILKSKKGKRASQSIFTFQKIERVFYELT